VNTNAVPDPEFDDGAGDDDAMYGEAHEDDDDALDDEAGTAQLPAGAADGGRGDPHHNDPGPTTADDMAGSRALQTLLGMPTPKSRQGQIEQVTW
jgi:hypothetical protein